eukprot:139500-Amphidinium_carterae.1
MHVGATSTDPSIAFTDTWDYSCPTTEAQMRRFYGSCQEAEIASTIEEPIRKDSCYRHSRSVLNDSYFNHSEGPPCQQHRLRACCRQLRGSILILPTCDVIVPRRLWPSLLPLDARSFKYKK